MGAAGCAERQSTASNGAEQHSTAPAPPAASCFRRSKWVPRPASHNCTRRQRTAVNGSQCRLVGDCPQVRPVKGLWRLGPYRWVQIGCRLAKWSPCPKCSIMPDRADGFTCGDVSERVGVTSQRTPKWSGSAPPHLADAGCRPEPGGTRPGGHYCVDVWIWDLPCPRRCRSRELRLESHRQRSD